MMFPGLDIFTNRQNNEVAPSSLLKLQRAKQIDSLRVYNQHVIEVNRDIKYRVGFTIAGQNYTLLVILPPQFPHEKPVISLWPPARHQWIHHQNLEVTECPGLNKFSVHSDLGMVVNSIIQEFQARPPTLIISNSHGPTAAVRSRFRQRSYSHGADLANDGSQPVSNQFEFRSHKTALSSSHPSLSDPLHSHIELSSLSLKELTALLEDEQSIMNFTHSVPVYKNLKKTFDDLRLENENISKQNLEMEPRLTEMKQTLIEKFEIAGTLQNQFETLMEKHHVLSEKFSPPAIRDRLHEAALQAEDESENIAEQFIDGQITVDDFLKEYMETKTRSYHQKVREEKLSQQLKELNKTWY